MRRPFPFRPETYSKQLRLVQWVGVIYVGVKRSVREAIAKVKNDWRYTSGYPVCLRGVHWDGWTRYSTLVSQLLVVEPEVHSFQELLADMKQN